MATTRVNILDYIVTNVTIRFLGEVNIVALFSTFEVNITTTKRKSPIFWSIRRFHVFY